MPWLFATAIFVGAAQLFLLEPMLAKMVLPRFGGAPAVWATCMVFFQSTLLAGYAYAHLLTTWLHTRRQVLVHLTLLVVCLAFLPAGIPESRAAAATTPVTALLSILVISAGFPFFMLSSTGSLLQRWFEYLGNDSGDPYYLYAASNAGSLIALLAYPLVVEPLFSLSVQTGIWKAAFYFWLMLMIGCGFQAWRRKKKDSLTLNSNASFRISHASRARWVILAFLPSSLLLGCTSHLSADVASFPLLWVVPLALYLLSLILTFARRTPLWLHRAMVLAFPVAIVFLLATEGTASLGTMAATHLVTFFVASMVFHGELARSRPPAQKLTEFYLWIAVGGALGSCFNALVAPALFSWIVEYPLSLALAAFMLPPLFPHISSRARILNRCVPIILGCAVAVCFWVNRHSFIQKGQLEVEERTFFGVFRVIRDDEGKSCVLLHGQIWQGMQNQSEDRWARRVPLLYYFPTSPIGQVFQAFHGSQGKARTAIIGMGIGNLAGYAESGQEFVFYEIDPVVERIARDRRYFHYLDDAENRGAAIKVILGDGRLGMQQDSAGRFGMIIIDAFSGDAIPTHLLTREAFQLYLEHLDEDGLLAIHISNDHVDLEPIVAELARDQELVALIQADTKISREERERGKAPSTWVVIARHRQHLGPLGESSRWKLLELRSSSILWRDDYTNLWPIIRWN
jgi:hypothetical protein